MTRYHLLLLPVLGAAILVLGGALHKKAPSSQPPIAVGTSEANDPEALAILDQACAALAPERIPWMEATVWQQVRCEDFVYQASGRLVTAPGDRLRFDLNVKVGGTVGELRVVNDGKVLWKSMRMGGDKPMVEHWNLPVLNPALPIPPEVTRARMQMMEEHAFAGLAPMLRSMRQRMKSAQVCQQHWRGREIHIISAAWPADAPTAPSAPDFTPPRFQVRQCCFYLDAQTFWPLRLEWWGAESPSQPNQLLTQTEYRTPVLNQPLSDERCASEFTFVEN